jgi:hypothetical protein
MSASIRKPGSKQRAPGSAASHTKHMAIESPPVCRWDRLGARLTRMRRRAAGRVAPSHLRHMRASSKKSLRLTTCKSTS